MGENRKLQDRGIVEKNGGTVGERELWESMENCGKRGIGKILGQGSNPHHSSDNASSLGH